MKGEKYDPSLYQQIVKCKYYPKHKCFEYKYTHRLTYPFQFWQPRGS